MNSLYISVVCMGMFYIRSFLAHPVQGTYANGMARGSPDRGSDAGVASTIVSQISQLLDMYHGAGHEKPIYLLHAPLPGEHARSNLWKTFSNDGLDARDSAVRNKDPDKVKLAYSLPQNLETLPLKRQQGWYVQYGKRNNGAMLSTKVSDRQTRNKRFEHSKDVFKTYSPLKKSYLNSNSKLTLIEPDSIINAKLLHNFNDRKSSNQFNNEQFYKDDNDNKRKILINNIHPDDYSHITKIKRQQGWFITYGKRSDEHLQLYLA